MAIKKKYNSINSQFAQQVRNNQNTIEVLTKLDQAVNSSDSFVPIKIVDDKGNTTITQVPTIGYFKTELDRINKTVKILSGIEGNPASVEIAQNAFKRIITADLNLEPRKIDNLDPVSVFKTNPNWIFDAFLNPKISVEIDLTDKIEQTIKSIQARRFIVTFEMKVVNNVDGQQTTELTANALLRKAEFETKYKGKSNIDIVEFVQWLKQPGLVNRVDNTLIDEDLFHIEPNRLQYQGSFSVLNTEIDTINKKMWFILDTLNYYDVSDADSLPKTVQLKVGDLVNVNPNRAGVTSTTVYKVIEISTITSDFRVRFEQVYGEEPIPVRINALNFYSEFVPSRKVRISIGYDEYNVLFLRALDDDNNLQGKEWSSGIGFYTNELTLDNNNGESFSEYYVKTVYDYGLVLEDLVQKKVPNYYGIEPNAPVLDINNFKVVQTNQHLTNTVEAEQIRDLHNNKNNLTSEIQQIQEAIDKKNRFISTSVFDSQSDRKRAEDELYTLQSKLTTRNETKFTVVKNILASQKNLNKINPTYKLRGFWAMPEAVTTTKTAPQEVVQFEIWYRRLSKSGAENPLSTFTNIDNKAIQSASDLNTTVNTNLSKAKTVNAVFSNWQKLKTDSRKRVQDPLTGNWLWQIEDVSDANTPNINQLEIDIFPGEKIEFKIKSLSEVGWPETPVESAFSNVIEYTFPEDLKNVLSDDQFILKEASADELKVQFERDMEARGLNLHLSSSFRVEDVYYAHKPEAISSGFRTDAGKVINLYDKLLDMVNHITALEEQIKRGKGELGVYLVNKGSKTRIFNSSSLNFNINLEDYMRKTKIGLLSNPVDSVSRTYSNEVYLIDDFSLEIKNESTDSPLGLLSYRNYGFFPGNASTDFAYTNKNTQGVWINNTNNLLLDTLTFNNGAGANLYPAVGSQTNNQWVWLQNKDFSNQDIYDDIRYSIGEQFTEIEGAKIKSDFGTNEWSTPKDIITDKVNELALTMQSPDKNFGFLGEKSLKNYSNKIISLLAPRLGIADSQWPFGIKFFNFTTSPGTYPNSQGYWMAIPKGLLASTGLDIPIANTTTYAPTGTNDKKLIVIKGLKTTNNIIPTPGGWDNTLFTNLGALSAIDFTFDAQSTTVNGPITDPAGPPYTNTTVLDLTQNNYTKPFYFTISNDNYLSHADLVGPGPDDSVTAPLYTIDYSFTGTSRGTTITALPNTHPFKGLFASGFVQNYLPDYVYCKIDTFGMTLPSEYYDNSGTVSGYRYVELYKLNTTLSYKNVNGSYLPSPVYDNQNDMDMLPIINGTQVPLNDIIDIDLSQEKYWSWPANIPALNGGAYGIQNALYGNSTNTVARFYDISGSQAKMGVAVVPAINDFTDIKDNSAQKVKLINTGDNNIIKIPIKIYFRPYTGTHIYNYNNINSMPNGATAGAIGTASAIGTYNEEKNDQSLALGTTGDLPNAPTVGSAYYLDADNNLVIEFVNTKITLNYLKKDDKMIINNLGSGLTQYNNIPISIKSISYGTTLIVTFNAKSTISSYSFTNNEEVLQVHIYTAEGANANTYYKQYSVKGKDKYINNYIEFYNSTNATPNPNVFNRKLRYFMESENTIRPTEFQLNWQFTQYKKILTS